MTRIAILADDLTGAADAGACFAQAGLATLVALDTAAKRPGCDVLVLSTESRHLAQDEAVACTQQVAAQVRRQCGESDTNWIYKKIDSTLRGHPEAELAMLMHALGLERALVAPAFPAQGRTTVGGRQHVDGAPLERTPFGGQVSSSDLLELFDVRAGSPPACLIDLKTVRCGPHAVSGLLAGLDPAICVADAETDADLATLAVAALACHTRLLCGSAGLARALAGVLPSSAGRQGRRGLPALGPPAASRHAGPILVVAGSRHARTLRQVELAGQRGAAIVRPAPALLDGDAATMGRIAQAAAGWLAAGRNVVLTTTGLADSPSGPQAVAACLAQVTCRLVAGGYVAGLILTGGDVAGAVCAALGASALCLQGEVGPGVAWGFIVDGRLPGLPFVTKAGGFGAEDTLAAAIEHLATVQARPPTKEDS